MRWQDKLTKKQKKHLKEMKMRTKRVIQAQADYHKAVDLGQKKGVKCYECSEIITRLEIVGVV